MPDNQKASILYILGPDMQSDMSLVRAYAAKNSIPLDVIGDGSRSITLPEIKKFISDNYQPQNKLTIIVDTHGTGDFEGQHQLQFNSEGDAKKVKTSELFAAIAEGNQNQPVECLFMPCFGELAASESSLLPNKSAVLFFSGHRSTTITEDTDRMFKALSSSESPNLEPTASNFLPKFLEYGIQKIDAPILVETSGIVQNPFEVLEKRIKNTPLGERFTNAEIRIIESLGQSNLVEGMSILNKANDIHTISAMDFGKALAVIQVISPEGESTIQDLNVLQAYRNKNIEAMSNLISNDNIAKTLDSKSLDIAFVFAAKMGEPELLKKTMHYKGNIGSDLSTDAVRAILSSPLVVTDNKKGFKHGDTLKVIELIDSQSKINWEAGVYNNQSDTLLHRVAEQGVPELTSYSLSHAKNANTLNVDGQTPLMIAAMQHSVDIKPFVENKDKVNWQTTDNDGNSALDHYMMKLASSRKPLSINSESGKETSEILIKMGARLSEENSDKLSDDARKWYDNQVKLSDAAKQFHSSSSSKKTYNYQESQNVLVQNSVPALNSVTQIS